MAELWTALQEIAEWAHRYDDQLVSPGCITVHPGAVLERTIVRGDWVLWSVPGATIRGCYFMGKDAA